MNIILNEKEEELFSILKKYVDKRVILAFSGGVDSTLLLKILSLVRKHNKDVIAVTFNTTLSPKNDLAISKKLASDFDVMLKILNINELDNESVINNKIDRCYHCKKSLFKKTIEIKNSLNYGYVLDGSNADDFKVFRPGIVALNDLNVKSPLKEANFTKSEVRTLAKKLGISVSNRPSAPCLATRFCYNEKLDLNMFKKIEDAEDYLKDCGFLINRIRVHKDIIRIEILKEDFNKFFQMQDVITSKLKEMGFSYITLDLEGYRSGSMDEVLSKEDKKRLNPWLEV